MFLVQAQREVGRQFPLHVCLSKDSTFLRAKLKIWFQPGIVAHNLSSSTSVAVQDNYEFEGSLGYRENSRFEVRLAHIV